MKHAHKKDSWQELNELAFTTGSAGGRYGNYYHLDPSEIDNLLKMVKQRCDYCGSKLEVTMGYCSRCGAPY